MKKPSPAWLRLRTRHSSMTCGAGACINKSRRKSQRENVTLCRKGPLLPEVLAEARFPCWVRRTVARILGCWQPEYSLSALGSFSVLFLMLPLGCVITFVYFSILLFPSFSWLWDFPLKDHRLGGLALPAFVSWNIWPESSAWKLRHQVPQGRGSATWEPGPSRRAYVTGDQQEWVEEPLS